MVEAVGLVVVDVVLPPLGRVVLRPGAGGSSGCADGGLVGEVVQWVQLVLGLSGIEGGREEGATSAEQTDSQRSRVWKITQTDKQV